MALLTLTPGYDIPLVAASFAVSALGAYSALTATGLVRGQQGRASRLNALLAGLALGGVGIWSMHFLGMLAWQTEGVAVGYEPRWTWLSLAAAVLASAVALAVGIAVVAATAALWLAFHVRSVAHRLLASLVMAAAVCTMHYTGLAAANVVCETTNALNRIAGLFYEHDLLFVVLALAGCVSALVAADAFLQRSERAASSVLLRGRTSH